MDKTSRNGVFWVVVFLGVVLMGLGVLLLNDKLPVITTITKGTVTQQNKDLDRIRKAGELIIGTAPDSPPTEFLDSNNQLTGYSADLIKELAKSFDVPIKIKYLRFQELFDELRSGKIDMIVSSITITDERAKTMSFSRPYFAGGHAITVRSDNTSIKNVQDLSKVMIGVEKGTTGEQETRKLTSEKYIKIYNNIDLAGEGLVKREVDAIVHDYPMSRALVNRFPELKIVGGPFNQEFWGIVVKKGNEGLLVPVNEVIIRLLRSGDLKRFEDKWFK